MEYPDEITRQVRNMFFFCYYVRQNLDVFVPTVWEINIQHPKLHLDLVFCIVSFLVMEEPAVCVCVCASEKGWKLQKTVY